MGDSVKQKNQGTSTISYKQSFEFLLTNPNFLKGLDLVKSLKPVTIPIHVKLGKQTQCICLRRTRRNHFNYLNQAEENNVSFERAVVNIQDSETRRFYLATLAPEGQPIETFLNSTANVQRKFKTLKTLAREVAKLNKAGLRHGDLLARHIFTGKSDTVTLTNPELDEEIVQHIHGDFDQLRETLLYLERELDHEPQELWEQVRKANYFKNVKV